MFIIKVFGHYSKKKEEWSDHLYGFLNQKFIINKAFPACSPVN